jgi:ribosome biogenesis protein UTP30
MVAKSPKTAMSPSKAVVATKKSKKQTSQQKKNKTMIPSPVDKHLVEKAVAALLKYHEAQSQNSKDLLGDDTQIQVQLSLLRAPANSSPKPIRIMIPNPFYKVVGDAADAASSSEDQAVAEEPEVCIIVKEESKPWVQDMIAKFPQHMGCVKKVLGLQSLRKKHAQYEQRRELLHKYNVFLADDRILPMLSKALGKDFFKAKKLPIPIALTRKEALPFAIQKALSATHMTLSSGTCLTIR